MAGFELSYFLINDGLGGFIADWEKVPDVYYEVWGPYKQFPNALNALLADLDSDGFPELITAPWHWGEDGSPWIGGIYWNDGTGDFSSAEHTPILPPAGTPICRFNGPYLAGGAMAAADIDSDEDIDLLVPWDGGGVCGDTPPTIQVFINRGNRNLVDETLTRFGPPPHGAPPGEILGMPTIDVNEDECVDLVFLTPQRPEMPPGFFESFIWLNDCTGRFVPIENAVLGKPGFLLPMDFDSDGDIDFLSTRYESYTPNQGPGVDWHDFTILENVRPYVVLLFADGFESGDTSAWSGSTP